MRGSKKPDRQWACVALAVFTLGGCGPQSTGGSWSIDSVRGNWANGRLEARCEQRIELSAPAREALEHGVPLTIELELILRDTASQTRSASKVLPFEIRYLPLSEHFQVSGGDEQQVRTYPRLRHALADLGDLNVVLETGALPSGEYEILTRSRLDQGRLPPPMRLPALLDSSWRNASDWTSWPLAIQAEE